MTQIDSWRTEISYVEPGRIVIRGYEIEELVASRSFGDVVYLLTVGRLPDRAAGRLVEAVLVALADHGVHAPSTIATRIAASSGTPLQASVAAGVASVGDHHGGALEGAMYAFSAILEAGGTQAAVADHIEWLGSEGRRFPGYGHPYHQPDPRGTALTAVAAEGGTLGPAYELVAMVETELRRRSPSPILANADGVAAALLLDVGVPPAAGRGIFIIARAAGLVAHAVEEERAERPVRMIDPATVRYAGPGAAATTPS